MFVIDLIMIIVVICTFAYWFGPTLVAAVGSFFSGVIYVTMFIITWPAIMIFTWKRRKKVDQIYDQLELAKSKNDYSQIHILTEQFEAAEKKVGNIIQVIVAIFFIIVILGLYMRFIS